MNTSIRKMKFLTKEAVTYFILGYKKIEKSKNDINLENILKTIIMIIKNTEKSKAIESIDKEMLEKIPVNWVIDIEEMVSYAICIFYVLLNRKEEITDETIVNEFISEIKTHHIKRTMQEAEFIAENFILNIK